MNTKYKIKIMRFVRQLIPIFFSCISPFLTAQIQTATPHKITVKKAQTFNPKTIVPEFAPMLKSREAPSPDGNSYQSFLARMKRDSVSKLYPRRESVKRMSNDTASQPKIKHEFDVIGTVTATMSNPLTGGTPLDNTLAISNGGLLMTAINSRIYAHDTNADTALFKNGFSRTIGFDQFAAKSSITTSFPFDPKLIYDPNADRFILAFLSGRTENDSKIIVGFSSTNNPVDPWYIYEVPGNPRGISNWSDYPALSITKKHLFITMNMIIPGVSWQVGFDGSIIWQIELQEGYTGLSSISPIWWDDIKFNGKYVRNLHPINGATEPLSNEMYFISNRNFDLSNDSLFLVKLLNSDVGDKAQLSVSMGKLDVPYGMPPNGKQEDTDLNDASKGLQTNDARWLGGILLDDKIQFVGNSVDPQTGNAAIYHGFIDGLRTTTPSFTGHIISDPVLDFGYPNIAFTGNDACESQTIIAFNHSSAIDFAGSSCVYFSNQKKYSKLTRIRNGENYVDNFHDNDSYERWGDYFGLQRQYNTPGEVWASGFFALSTKNSSVHIAQIQSPDSDYFSVQLDTAVGLLNQCEGQILPTVVGGIAPHSFIWNGSSVAQNTLLDVNLCDGSYTLEIKDAANCRISYKLNFNDSTAINTVNIKKEAVFPNPFSERLVIVFSLDEPTDIEVIVYDSKGAAVTGISKTKALKGINEFSFSTLPLESGFYVARVVSNNNVIAEEKLIKVE